MLLRSWLLLGSNTNPRHQTLNLLQHSNKADKQRGEYEKEK